MEKSLYLTFCILFVAVYAFDLDNTAYFILSILFIVGFISNMADRWVKTRKVYGSNGTYTIWPADEQEAKLVAERNTDIMMQTMLDLGCQPEKEDDDPYAFHVTYQGEIFHFFCADPYICICDYAWNEVDSKAPEYPTIREAINTANCRQGPKVVMTDCNENGMRQIHSHTSFLLYPRFSDHSSFVKGQLSSFFSIKEDMRNTYHQLVAKQQQAVKQRNPIGFTAGARTEDNETAN